MPSRWYVYGEVFFSSTTKRNNASKRLDNLAASYGFTGEAWSALGVWPSGKLNITGTSDAGGSVAGFRFCYSTTNPDAAEAAIADISAAWDVLQTSRSWWAWQAII